MGCSYFRNITCSIGQTLWQDTIWYDIYNFWRALKTWRIATQSIARRQKLKINETNKFFFKNGRPIKFINVKIVRKMKFKHSIKLLICDITLKFCNWFSVTFTRVVSARCVRWNESSRYCYNVRPSVTSCVCQWHLHVYMYTYVLLCTCRVSIVIIWCTLVRI